MIKLALFRFQTKPPIKPKSTNAAKKKPVAKSQSPMPEGKSPLGSARTLSRTANPKLQECQYCSRSFNVKAYDNHVNWCKEKSIKAMFQQQTNASDLKAMERMKARIHYKPPCPK